MTHILGRRSSNPALFTIAIVAIVKRKSRRSRKERCGSGPVAGIETGQIRIAHTAIGPFCRRGIEKGFIRASASARGSGSRRRRRSSTSALSGHIMRSQALVLALHLRLVPYRYRRRMHSRLRRSARRDPQRTLGRKTRFAIFSTRAWVGRGAGNEQ